MTLPKNTVKEALKEERRKSRQQWITSFGWRSCNHRTRLESLRHPLHPDLSRIEELMIVCIRLMDSWENGKDGIPNIICICTSYTAMYVCVRACVRACVCMRVCVHACMRACVRACVRGLTGHFPHELGLK